MDEATHDRAARHARAGHCGTFASGADKIRKYKLPIDSNPEGVVYDQQTDAFYGGATNPTVSSPNDGTVYKGKLDDHKAEVFMKPGEDGAGNPDPTRTQTHGFNVDKQDRLYIAGVETGLLHVYQLPEGNKVATFSTGAGGYINDVAISPTTGDVYFTDSQRPILWHLTKAQVDAGTGTPEAVPIDPPVDYGPSTRTNNKLEANGIRVTPDGKYVIFDSLNNGELYRYDPASGSTNPDIQKIGGVTPKQLGNADGLEFLDSNTLYSVDNSGTMKQTPLSFDESPERIVKLQLSDDYLTAKVLRVKKSRKFHTPAAASLIPNGRLLITNAEFFDGDGMAPFFDLSIPRP